jgi:hypothetical protein
MEKVQAEVVIIARRGKVSLRMSPQLYDVLHEQLGSIVLGR